MGQTKIKNSIFVSILCLFVDSALSLPIPPPCSLIASSGSNIAYSSLSSFLNKKNNEIERYWENEISPVIDRIKEESEKREEKIKILKRIEQERLLLSKEMEFLLKQESELLGNLSNIEVETQQ